MLRAISCNTFLIGLVQHLEIIPRDLHAKRAFHRPLWHTSPLPCRLGKLTLSLVVRISLINWQIVLLLTGCSFDTRSFLDGRKPFVESSPDRFVLSAFGNSETAFVMIKDPQSNLCMHSYQSWVLFAELRVEETILTIQGAIMKSIRLASFPRK